MHWNRLLLSLLAMMLLVLTAHRSPAPIVEENPTPAPTESTESKSVSHSKSAKAVSSDAETSQPARSHAAAAQGRSGPKFSGTWHGMISLGITGNYHLTLTVNSAGNNVTESGGLLGTTNLKATNDGKTVTWRSGFLHETSWTLTPNSDGTSATVIASNPLVGSPSATFTRGPGTSTSGTTASLPQAEIPIARPDPDRPGFVYNPFDPSSSRRLDVRGKKSGTKVKDPVSGKFFIVP